MAVYLALRMEAGKLNYNTAFARASLQTFKSDVDTILAADGYTVNQDGTVTKD